MFCWQMHFCMADMQILYCQQESEWLFLAALQAKITWHTWSTQELTLRIWDIQQQMTSLWHQDTNSPTTPVPVQELASSKLEALIKTRQKVKQWSQCSTVYGKTFEGENLSGFHSFSLNHKSFPLNYGLVNR